MSQVLLPDDADRRLKDTALVAYILLGVSLFTALPTGLIAVIVAYVKRDDARGSWLEGHFQWQIATFWCSIIGFIVAWICAFTLIGIPLAIVIGVGTWIWTLYRVVKGFLRLKDNREVRA